MIHLTGDPLMKTLFEVHFKSMTYTLENKISG